jgi:hypothetical protein
MRNCVFVFSELTSLIDGWLLNAKPQIFHGFFYDLSTWFSNFSDGV